MFSLDPISWSAADDATDPWHNYHAHDRVDALVLHEARMTTDYRQASAPVERISLFDRIRHLFAGGIAATTPEACNCPA